MTHIKAHHVLMSLCTVVAVLLTYTGYTFVKAFNDTTAAYQQRAHSATKRINGYQAADKIQNKQIADQQAAIAEKDKVIDVLSEQLSRSGQRPIASSPRGRTQSPSQEPNQAQQPKQQKPPSSRPPSSEPPPTIQPPSNPPPSDDCIDIRVACIPNPL